MKAHYQMIKQWNRMFTLLSLTALLVFASCEDKKEGTPSKPTMSLDASTLGVKLGDSKVITATISAAGKIKSVTATVDKGTVAVADITSIIGKNTGTATINYTAPQVLGAAKITIEVTDNINQKFSVDVSVDITAQPPVEIAAGNVEGTWGPFRTYNVRGSVTVAAGKTLRVLEGTTVIVDGDGTQANSPSIFVAGNFYSYGTATNPVLFSVPEAKRTKANIFAGLWGGILGTIESQEMAVINTRIEFVGAPAAANTSIVTSGELKEGDPRFGLYFTNPNGKFVMMNSTIAYSKDDGLRVNQGKFLVANNNFILNGQTGGDALNIKSGAVGDAAFNVFFQAATNGIKFSNSDGRDPQMEANVYNNTAINCGWRQTKSGRGGSFNLEKGGRGKIYNNIIVNCKFGVRFPKAPDNPDVVNCAVGYNLYYGAKDVISAQFYPSSIGTIVKGDYETNNDVSGATDTNNPNFVNFAVTTFDEVAAANPANMDFPAAWNLKPNTGSPALAKSKTNFTTKFTTHSLDGKNYTVPAPAANIGAIQ
ncbi:MAG: hypothetical protein ACOVMQ_07515 [Cyclobacteriaceae bacterium]|jgi:hypothetical protein